MSQELRHKLLQKLFWNRAGSKLVTKIAHFEWMFDTVVRGYSLMGHSNGERWLPTLIDEDAVIFDVGFYDGASTAALLDAKPKSRVVSFDPSRFGRESYKARFADDPRVTFENLALSNVAGEETFYDYENMCSSLAARKELPREEVETYTVAITTLDAYCRKNLIDRIHFVKIDAEGFDLHVLEGAHDLLAGQAIDMFMFEFASGWAATKTYLWQATEYFESLPYKLFRLHNGFLVPLVYDIRIDSCTARPCMYVGVSDTRLARGDIESRNYQF